MSAPLLNTWAISQRINEFLLTGVKEEYFADRSAAKGRTVGEQFAHIHNVRLMWLKASAPELMTGLEKIEKEEVITKEKLLDGLRESGVAIGKLLAGGMEKGRIKGFKPHPEGFLGYMIAHEAHHRGQIVVTLKENKHLPEKNILYGMWEWGSR
ncbi:MAG TPA: DinB family protein [Chlamydiales bacterium]|nr:DinB family protein [Chlamydiales bacterium]